MGPRKPSPLAGGRPVAQVRDRSVCAHPLGLTQRRGAIARSSGHRPRSGRNRLLARAISQVQVRVREGKGMARPLGESGLFPPLSLNMIAVGEETGKLDGMLSEVAEHYDQEVKRTTKRLTA